MNISSVLTRCMIAAILAAALIFAWHIKAANASDFNIQLNLGSRQTWTCNQIVSNYEEASYRGDWRAAEYWSNLWYRKCSHGYHRPYGYYEPWQPNWRYRYGNSRQYDRHRDHRSRPHRRNRDH